MSRQPSGLERRLAHTADYLSLAGTLGALVLIGAWVATLTALLIHALTR